MYSPTLWVKQPVLHQYATTFKSTAMKKLIRFSALLLLAFGPGRAFSQIVLGAKFTANHNWQKYAEGTNAANADLSVWGMGASAYVLYQMNSHFAIGVEPGLVQRGTKCLPGYILPYPGDAKIVCNFIEMPIVGEASWKVWQDRLLLFGRVGGGLSRAVGGYQEISSLNPEVPVRRSDLVIKDEPWINKWEKGIQAGLGLGVKAGPGYISLETRYYQALNDFSERTESKNRSLGYSLGYRIAL